MLEVPYSYSYPKHKTGTAQDLMSVVTRAYEVQLQRTGTVLPAKSDWQRVFLEAPFILMGLAVSKTLELLPKETVMEAHNQLFNALSAPHRYEFDAASPVLERARLLAGRVEAETGRAPALLALISHPPVLGDMAHLNFSLVRHAMLALRAVRAKPCRPRLLVATDFFALDSIPVYQEGLYQGFMGDYHLGFDRICLSRQALSRCLLPGAAWDKTPLRLLNLLAGGEELGLVLAGGVPGTTRILYAVREWLGRARRNSPMKSRPVEVLRRLRADEDFTRFCAEAPLGGKLASNAWRMAEAWAMASLAGVYTGRNGSAESGAESGTLTGSARGCLLRCLDALGIARPEAEAELERLAAELKRETPFRERFFRILAGRVLERGRPVVFVPVAHRVKPEWGVGLGEAWAWKDGGRGKVSALLSSGGSWEGRPEEFAVAFGKENFE